MAQRENWCLSRLQLHHSYGRKQRSRDIGVSHSCKLQIYLSLMWLLLLLSHLLLFLFSEKAKCYIPCISASLEALLFSFNSAMKTVTKISCLLSLISCFVLKFARQIKRAQFAMFKSICKAKNVESTIQSSLLSLAYVPSLKQTVVSCNTCCSVTKSLPSSCTSCNVHKKPFKIEIKPHLYHSDIFYRYLMSFVL